MIPTDLLIKLILAGVEQLPKLIAAIEASAEHTAEEKAAIRKLVRDRLDATNAGVQAVDTRGF